MFLTGANNGRARLGGEREDGGVRGGGEGGVTGGEGHVEAGGGAARVLAIVKEVREVRWRWYFL